MGGSVKREFMVVDVVERQLWKRCEGVFSFGKLTPFRLV